MREPPSLGLKQLNPREIEVLELLAQGHTVKSIAGLTGRTPASINERLREARRKTGASSSRELARLLHHEKFVPKKIGIAGEPLQTAAPSRTPLWRHRGVLFGGLIMIPLLALALNLPALQPHPAVAPATSRQAAVARPAPRRYNLRLTLYHNGRVLVRPGLLVSEGNVVRASSNACDITVVLLPITTAGRIDLSFAITVLQGTADRRFSGSAALDKGGTARVQLSRDDPSDDYSLEIATDPTGA